MDISLGTLSDPNSQDCQSQLSYDNIILISIVSASIGLVWGIYNYIVVRRIDVMEEG